MATLGERERERERGAEEDEREMETGKEKKDLIIFGERGRRTVEDR